MEVEVVLAVPKQNPAPQATQFCGVWYVIPPALYEPAGHEVLGVADPVPARQ